MKNLRWVSSFHKGRELNLVLLLVGAALLALLNVLNAWCLQTFVSIGARESTMPLFRIILYTLLVVVGTGALNVGMEALRKSAVLHAEKRMKMRVLRDLCAVPLQKLERLHTGDLQARLSDDVTVCAKILPESVLTLVSGAMSCLAGLIYALSLSWVLTLIVLVLTPIAALFARKLFPLVEKDTVEVRSRDSEARAFSQEMLGNPVSVRVFSMGAYVVQRFGALFSAYARAALRQAVRMAAVGAGSGILGFLSFAASVATGAFLALRGEMTIGAVVGFLQLLNFIVWPFTDLTQRVGEIRAALVSADRVRELLREEEQEEGKAPAVPDSIAQLSIQHLSFAYEEGRDVLRDLNFEMAAPGVLLVRGESGAGKSTLLKLLMGLYAPTSGSLFAVDGNGKRQPLSTPGLCAFVPQDHILFSGTIRENICLGEASDPVRLQRALDKARLTALLSQLPEGVDTPVHENAQNLSFGQAQRVAIARALYRDSPVLILDEPTASLDEETRQDIYRMLREEGKHRLCILVSHDGAAAAFADATLEIRKLENG
ncbi:MAG: ABC transporter ATP-binding protein [Candidatus Spyradocola sp.]|jgi:ATP-binding cassette subfamily B protein